MESCVTSRNIRHQEIEIIFLRQVPLEMCALEAGAQGCGNKSKLLVVKAHDMAHGCGRHSGVHLSLPRPTSVVQWERSCLSTAFRESSRYRLDTERRRARSLYTGGGEVYRFAPKNKTKALGKGAGR